MLRLRLIHLPFLLLFLALVAPSFASDLIYKSPQATYEVTQELGRGSISVVFEATKTAADGTKSQVALKVFKDGTIGEQEYRDIAVEGHRLVLREMRERSSEACSLLLQVGELTQAQSEIRERTVVALELGIPFHDVLLELESVDAEGKIRFFERFIEQSIGALRQLNQMGLVHNDVKPSNFLLIGEGGSQRDLFERFVVGKVTLRLADYDAVMRINEIEHSSIGTVDYLAPERWIERLHQAISASDYYSLGLATLLILGEVTNPHQMFYQEVLVDGDRALNQVLPFDTVDFSLDFYKRMKDSQHLRAQYEMWLDVEIDVWVRDTSPRILDTPELSKRYKRIKQIILAMLEFDPAKRMERIKAAGY